MKMEQKLDWTLLRKKAEINDSLGRPLKVRRVVFEGLGVVRRAEVDLRSSARFAYSYPTLRMIRRGRKSWMGLIPRQRSTWIQERASPAGSCVSRGVCWT